MDIDGKGKITFSNLKRVLTFELQMEVDDEMIKDMVDVADCDGDDLITERDFVKLMKKLHKLKK